MKGNRWPEVEVWIGTPPLRNPAPRRREPQWQPRVLGLIGTFVLHVFVLRSFMLATAEHGYGAIKAQRQDPTSITRETDNWMAVVLIQPAPQMDTNRQLVNDLASQGMIPKRMAVSIENVPLPERIVTNDEHSGENDRTRPFSHIGVPPTETVHSIALESSADLTAFVVNEAALLDICRRRYPRELANKSEMMAVELRVFVMPDGRIGQGTIEHSSGDQRLDSITLGCLQAYGDFEPAVVSNSRIGSWQRLTWLWR